MNCRMCGESIGEPTHGDVDGFALRNGEYGCDSGCMIVVAEIKCPSCSDSWEGWTFGEIMDDADTQQYGEELFRKYEDYQ